MVPPLTDLQHLRTQAKKVMFILTYSHASSWIFSQTFQSFPTDMHQLSGLRLLSHLQFR